MRLTPLAWLLLASLVGAVVAWPFSEGLSVVLGALFGLLVLAAVVEGFGANAGWFDIGTAADRKREVLTSRFKRGRPEWERTAPDFADEPQDAIFERERTRRGLG
jgi:hypothetical protein